MAHVTINTEHPKAVLAAWHDGLARAGLAGLTLAILAAALLAPPAGIATAAAGAVIGHVIVRRQAALHFPRQRFGLCNTLTLWRGALAVALLASAVFGQVAGWTVAAVASLALVLDGLDGWSARRDGLESGFGARFDMEVDSVLAAVLGLHAALSGIPWPVALVLGGARYGFVAAGFLAPWLRHPLPPAFWRKAVCVGQMSALIAVQLPVVTGVTAHTVAAGAATALLLSFARDILWLRSRP